MERTRPGQPSARATTWATTASGREGMVRRTSSPACSAESAGMVKTWKVGPGSASVGSTPSTSTSLVPAERARSSRASPASPRRSASSTSTTASAGPRGSRSRAPSSISSASATLPMLADSIQATGRSTPRDQAMRRSSVLRPELRGPVMTMPPPARSAAICAESAVAGPSSPAIGHTRPRASAGSARWAARRSALASSSALG